MRGLLLFGVLAVILAAAPAHARLADHNPVGIVDAVGDSGSAPDIRRVTVANSNAGELLFVVQLANRTDITPNDTVAIAIDSDRNGQTGEPNGDGGIDYLIWISGTDRTVLFLRWSGARYEPVESTSLRAAWVDGYVVSVDRAELGNATAIRFFVQTGLESDETSYDEAPDGLYHDYAIVPPHVDSITPRFAPAAPRAGATFRLSSVQLAFETAEKAPAALFSCRATLAGRRLVGTGRGGCTFRLPKTAKGKRLVVTITAAAAGGRAQAFRAYTFRVR